MVGRPRCTLGLFGPCRVQPCWAATLWTMGTVVEGAGRRTPTLDGGHYRGVLCTSLPARETSNYLESLEVCDLGVPQPYSKRKLGQIAMTSSSVRKGFCRPPVGSARVDSLAVPVLPSPKEAWNLSPARNPYLITLFAISPCHPAWSPPYRQRYADPYGQSLRSSLMAQTDQLWLKDGGRNPTNTPNV